MRSPLTILRERRAYRFTDQEPTTVMPAVLPLQLCTECGARHSSDDDNTLCERFTPAVADLEPDITRIETGGNWLDELWTARLGNPDHEDTDPGAWASYNDAVTDPTVQLTVQRMYDGPTCTGCGAPSFVTPCVACATREAR